MYIKPIDFLEARASIDYTSKVFDLDLDDELYTFHVYNLAAQLSLISNRSEDAINVMSNQNGFIEKMNNFSDRYWEIIQSSK